MAKRRPPDPASGYGQKHLRLATAVLRAETLAQLVRGTGASVPTTTRDRAQALIRDILTVTPGAVSKWFSYLQVYYAAVQILIETLRQTKLSSPEIDRLLSDTEKRELLLDFRDDLLHGGSLLSQSSAAFFANMNEVDGWAYELRLASEQLVLEFFSKEAARQRLLNIKLP